MSPLALVTGASSGIGKAFAQRLASNGYDLIIVGRRRDRLKELAASLPSVKVQVVAADLSTDDGIETVAVVCASQPLTMLVNNAGVGHYMPMADLPADKARELVKVKVLAPTMLTRCRGAKLNPTRSATLSRCTSYSASSYPCWQGFSGSGTTFWSRTCSCGINSTSRSVPVLALTSSPETGSSGWWSGASTPTGSSI